MSKFKTATFVSGLILGIGISVGSVALAASTNVTLLPVKFIVNKVDKTPLNGQFIDNGIKVPASIVYNGTVYAPVKMVTSMLGYSTNWDAKNKSLLIGDTSSGLLLSDQNPIQTEGGVKSNNIMSIGKQEFNKGFLFADNKASVVYNLDGQYSTLKFQFGIDDSKTYPRPGTLKVIGDGKELWQSPVLIGTPAQETKINISGVLHLEIRMECKDSLGTRISVVNPLVTK
ncbi:NPCBM/NEW2 domain-containing protein [Brevibacillus choshinensis]|uniref:NPCBM/NEW2 domain-containing protein n=1 Tax=Brevibacillus choshinensis TaxID=54911 RepID=A0ABX7FPH9_BRECH|nr:NPCBM/NEW2 domain-containing protein [Brevibacillus choshinensis]QRG67725.1 NPCBM/NEW2 domain-containing protein [Brevibacillus choshinensis]